MNNTYSDFISHYPSFGSNVKEMSLDNLPPFPFWQGFFAAADIYPHDEKQRRQSFIEISLKDGFVEIPEIITPELDYPIISNMVLYGVDKIKLYLGASTKRGISRYKTANTIFKRGQTWVGEAIRKLDCFTIPKRERNCCFGIGTVLDHNASPLFYVTRKYKVEIGESEIRIKDVVREAYLSKKLWEDDNLVYKAITGKILDYMLKNNKGYNIHILDDINGPIRRVILPSTDEVEYGEKDFSKKCQALLQKAYNNIVIKLSTCDKVFYINT